MTTYIKIQNDIFDAATTNFGRLAEQYLSDDDYDAFFSTATDYDEDGDPVEWEMVERSNDEIAAHIRAEPMTADEALEAILAGANYCGYELNEKIAIASADPEFIAVKSALTTAMVEAGWTLSRDKNNSAYYDKAGARVRFSNHRLGTDWTGRTQTGGADIDIVWEKNMTAETAMEEINERII